MERIIFARYKYNILIKHEAVIRAMDLNYEELIDTIALRSPDHDLVKTAISYLQDDILLAELALGGNQFLPLAKQGAIQKLALQRIMNEVLFLNTAIKVMDKLSLTGIFQKLQKKGTLRGISKFYIRLIPVILHQIPTHEVITEFQNTHKYSTDINSKLTDIQLKID